MNKEEKITISVNEEDVQNIINAYEKDIEYINQLEKENQELKRKLNEAIHKATEFESEVYELKKQLEEYKRLGFKYLQDKNNNLETQQEEFIEYLTSYIDLLSDNPDLIEDAEIDILEEILSKYQEIIRGK